VLHGAADRPAQAVLTAAGVVLDAAPAGVEQATDRARLAGVTHHVLAAGATLEELAGHVGGPTAATALALAARAQLTAADALAGLGATSRARHALAAARRLAADVGDTADRDNLLHTALRVEGKMHAYGLLAGPVPPALAGCDPTAARTPAQVAVAFQAARLGARAWPPARVQAHVDHALDAAEKLPATGASGIYVGHFSPANALYHALVTWADCGAAPLAERHYPQVATDMAGHPASLAVADYAMAQMYTGLGRLDEATEHTRRAHHADPGHRACHQARAAACATASTHRSDPRPTSLFADPASPADTAPHSRGHRARATGAVTPRRAEAPAPPARRADTTLPCAGGVR
jgi:hypothetical protein